MVDERIIDIFKRKKRITRKELSKELHCTDRCVRDKIADINVAEGPYKGIFIIGTSDKNGYRLAEDIEDLKHFIFERKKRAESVLLPVKKAERLIREMEEWTS